MNGMCTTSTGSSLGGSSSRSWSPRRSITVRTPWSTSAPQPSSLRPWTLSERTIAPRRVSLPSAVGRPPSSRTLRQPSHLRSRASGGNGCQLRAFERGRSRGLDPHLDEVAGRRRAGKVDRRVPARPSAKHARVGPARPLDEHLLDAADTLTVPRPGTALHALDEPLDPLALHLVGNLTRQRRR